MDTQIEQLLCETCRPVFAAAIDVERKQLAVDAARERLKALGISATIVSTGQPAPTNMLSAIDKTRTRKSIAADAVTPDPYKGRRNARWRDVPIVQVIRNIRGDIAPNDLCEKLGIATSVLRSRVKDIIGQPDAGKRWQKGVGYVIKGKTAWDHELGTLRVDKTKGKAMAAFTESARTSGSSTGAAGNQARKPAGKGGAKSKPGPTDEELKLFEAGKISVTKLAKKHKCGKSKIYRLVHEYRARFGADAEHGSGPTKLDPLTNGSNGVTKIPSLPDGVGLDLARIVGN